MFCDLAGKMLHHRNLEKCLSAASPRPEYNTCLDNMLIQCPKFCNISKEQISKVQANLLVSEIFWYGLCIFHITLCKEISVIFLYKASCAKLAALSKTIVTSKKKFGKFNQTF